MFRQGKKDGKTDGAAHKSRERYRGEPADKPGEKYHGGGLEKNNNERIAYDQGYGNGFEIVIIVI
ncbi:hypothetical protein [Streptococcus catagoni]|uniref:hypothetical protein n=1 Tax=Streptococcus catagoni TaxID=2654874 RepID=UPI00140D2B14|nr:hypothetical protein [Streptococcus catagoni]